MAWYGDSRRHSLARKGIRTAKVNPMRSMGLLNNEKHMDLKLKGSGKIIFDTLSEEDKKTYLGEIDNGLSHNESLKAVFDKYNSSEEFVEAQNTAPFGKIYLYRGLEDEFDTSHDLTTTDAPNNYSTWTDNSELARQYAGANGFVYRLELSEEHEGEDIIDEDGERPLFFNNDKSAGLNGITGNEFLVYIDHEKYSLDTLTQVESRENLSDMWNEAKETRLPVLKGED